MYIIHCIRDRNKEDEAHLFKKGSVEGSRHQRDRTFQNIISGLVSPQLDLIILIVMYDSVLIKEIPVVCEPSEVRETPNKSAGARLCTIKQFCTTKQLCTLKHTIVHCKTIGHIIEEKNCALRGKKQLWRGRAKF